MAQHCRQIAIAESLDLETFDMKIMSIAQIDQALVEEKFAIGHHVLAWLLSKQYLMAS